MLKWVDLLELMGYLTALFSVSVSYASRLQEEHYSDFLRQNEGLRNTLLSPFFSKIVMILIAGCFVYYLLGILKKEEGEIKIGFGLIYVFFLGSLIELFLWNLQSISFVGAPMLLVGLIIIFYVELSKAYGNE